MKRLKKLILRWVWSAVEELLDEELDELFVRVREAVYAKYPELVDDLEKVLGEVKAGWEALKRRIRLRLGID